jgi:hypothetical protein
LVCTTSYVSHLKVFGDGAAFTAGALANKFYGHFGVPGTIVYRRTDDPNNQNIYLAPSDSGAQIVSNLMLTRGSSAAYLVGTSADSQAAAVLAPSTGSEAFTTGTNTTGAAINEVFFVNGRGPMTALGAQGATSLTVKNPSTAFGKFFPRAVTASGTKYQFPVSLGITTDADRTTVKAGAVLLLDGRRYRVRARGGATATGIDGKAKVTLSENYAGGSLEKVCDNCVAITTEISLKTASTAASSAGQMLDLAVGDQVLMEGAVHGDHATTIVTVNADQRTFVTSKGGALGLSANPMGVAGVTLTADTATAALYKTRYGALGAPTVTVVTETSTGANTYNYVAQCSNRGTCDSSTGLCKCFKGYASDNCDKQNMLAM